MYIKNADNQRNTMLMRLSRAHRFLIVSVLPPVLLNVRNCLIINHLKLFYKDVFLRMRQIPAAINVLSEVKNQVSGNLYYLSNLITLVIQRRISDCSYAAVSFMYGNPSVLGLPFYAKNNNSDTLFTISTSMVSLRCAFVCSCASNALFWGKPSPWACLSVDNNTDNNNIDFQGDAEAYSDSSYASVSFGQSLAEGLLFCAKNKNSDTFFKISTSMVSLRRIFDCSCASIAFFLGKLLRRVCLSLDNNSNTDNNNIDFQGDTGASFDRLYASVSLSKNGSSSGALLGDCLFL